MNLYYLRHDKGVFPPNSISVIVCFETEYIVTIMSIKKMYCKHKRFKVNNRGHYVCNETIYSNINTAVCGATKSNMNISLWTGTLWSTHWA